MKPEYVEIAKQSILLANIPDDITNSILSRSSIRKFERGESIFVQGDDADSIYIVISGWVKLYRITPMGSEAVVGVFTKGRSFGEAAAFRGDIYPVSAEASTESMVIHIPTSVYLNLMRKEPELALSILSATFAHLHALVTQVEQLKANTGAQRVAQFLHSLCDESCDHCTVTLPYDKVLIAGRLGIKPESLSRAFSQLRDMGVTVRKNHAEIASVSKLGAFAEVE